MTIEKKLHVLVIPSWYPKDANDARGSFFREQAKALQRQNLKVGVITLEMNGFSSLAKGYTRPMLDVEIDGGLPTFRYFYTNLIPKLDKLITTGWVKRGEYLFNQYVAKYGMPDIIHAHSIFKAGFLAEFLSEKYKLPFVLTEHSSAFARNLITSKQIQRSKTIINSAKAIIAVSGEFKTLLDSIYFTNKWEYIPNIVNEEFFNKAEKNINYHHNDKTTFLTVCALLDKKKVDILIRAFFELQKKCSDVQLKIGGDGPEMSNLCALVKELKLQHLVTFLGKLSREQVKDEMLRSDIFVLPSEYETFGVVVIEALASGKPVVATKCGGPESIISDAVGRLVAVNNPILMSQAMEEVYQKLDSYNSDSIRNYCYEKFSESAVTSKIINRYTDILINNG